MSADFLSSMAAASAGRVQRAQQLRPEAVLRDFVALLPPPTPLRLSVQGYNTRDDIARLIDAPALR